MTFNESVSVRCPSVRSYASWRPRLDDLLAAIQLWTAHVYPARGAD